MRRLMLTAALMLAIPVGAHASLESLTKDAKDGKSVAFVMQQAKAEGTPVDTLLAELIKAGVVRAENIKDSVAAATKADPVRAGAIVTVALSSFKSQAAAILKAAYANAPAQAAQIAASAKAASVSDKVVATAQAAAQAEATSPGLVKTTASSNINVAPFSTPSAGGGGGGSASPN
jgi:hypothetical protein